MIRNDDISKKKTIGDFTPEEIEAAHEAHNAYMRERRKRNKEERRASEIRYWLRKARESENQ